MKSAENIDRQRSSLALLTVVCLIKEKDNAFRIKVHGIKGASRQIGRAAISEKAEI